MVETMAQLHDCPGSKPNFVPRSSMKQPLGLLSRAAGMDWVKVDNFHNRLLTMAHVFECRENLHCLESQFERDAMKIDLAMQVRLNSRFRAHTPSSKFATGHYRHHFQQRMRAGISRKHALQELRVNAALVRTTLSFEVRCALKGLIFPWLHVCNGEITNFADLDEVVLRLQFKVFGDYVNPQRQRSRDPKQGYLDLVRELVGLARATTDLSGPLLEPSLRNFMKAGRLVSVGPASN